MLCDLSTCDHKRTAAAEAAFSTNCYRTAEAVPLSKADRASRDEYVDFDVWYSTRPGLLEVRGLLRVLPPKKNCNPADGGTYPH